MFHARLLNDAERIVLRKLLGALPHPSLEDHPLVSPIEPDISIEFVNLDDPGPHIFAAFAEVVDINNVPIWIQFFIRGPRKKAIYLEFIKGDLNPIIRHPAESDFCGTLKVPPDFWDDV